MEPSPIHTPFVHPMTQYVWAWIFGRYPYIGTLAVLQILDVLTGLIAAWKFGKANSSASMKGAHRKALVWAIVIAFAIAAREYPQIPAVRLIASLYILSELISILENSHLCGVWLPPGVLKGLRAIREFQSNSEKLNMMNGAKEVIVPPIAPTVIVNMPEQKPQGNQPLVIREIYGEDQTRGDTPKAVDIVATEPEKEAKTNE